MNEKIRMIMLITGLILIFLGTMGFILYSIILKKKIKRLEKVLPKKGKECFCYIYYCTNGDNSSKIYYVVVHLENENINKRLKYQTYNKLKLKCNQVVKGYYYKNKVVLDKKCIDIKKLPQNIIDAFELNNEEAL